MARIFAALFKRLGQVAVCGEIATGLILGPSVFGKLSYPAFHHVFDPSVFQFLAMLSQVGLILLLFLIGMEFEFNHLRAHAGRAVAMSLSGILLPFGSGLLLAKFIHPFVAKDVSFVGFALFTATAMSITALPTLGRILIALNLNRTPLGVIALTAAAMDDAFGWTILAAISAIVRAQFRPLAAARMLLETLLFAAVLLYVVRPLLKKWIRHVLETEGQQISSTTLTILLVLIFAAAIVTSLIGIFSIFGAFMMGMIIFDQEEFRRAIVLRLRDFVYTFFVPLFFVYTGLRTDISALQDPFLWELCVLVIGVAIAGKAGGCLLTGRLSGLSWRDSVAVALLMNTRGLMELIVVNVGYDLGVIPRSVFVMLTLMAVVTTYMTVPLVRRILHLDGFKLELDELSVGPTIAKS
jgi:Kef-type K+ transport system membrane component KefB